jgi:hypothetical protein
LLPFGKAQTSLFLLSLIRNFSANAGKLLPFGKAQNSLFLLSLIRNFSLFLLASYLYSKVGNKGMGRNTDPGVIILATFQYLAFLLIQFFF